MLFLYNLLAYRPSIFFFFCIGCDTPFVYKSEPLAQTSPQPCPRQVAVRVARAAGGVGGGPGGRAPGAQGVHDAARQRRA